MSTGGRKLGEAMGCSIPISKPKAWLKSWFTRSRREVNSKEGSLRVMLAIEFLLCGTGLCFLVGSGLERAHKTWPHENMRCNSQLRREPARQANSPREKEASASDCGPTRTAKPFSSKSIQSS